MIRYIRNSFTAIVKPLVGGRSHGLETPGLGLGLYLQLPVFHTLCIYTNRKIKNQTPWALIGQQQALASELPRLWGWTRTPGQVEAHQRRAAVRPVADPVVTAVQPQKYQLHVEEWNPLNMNAFVKPASTISSISISISVSINDFYLTGWQIFQWPENVK